MASKNGTKRPINGKRRKKGALGYDAAATSTRRRQIATKLTTEDRVLRQHARRRLNATAHDIRRNFSIAAWMIRKHLDYVATFTFHSRSGDPALDRDLEALMTAWMRPNNCDVAGRHPFTRWLRILEACRTVDGDVLAVFLDSGRLQAIESYRIQDPPRRRRGERWIHGVRTNRAGRANAYAVYSDPDGLGLLQFERIVPARNAVMHGFYDRFDQVRGISPIVAALNPLRDVYENFEYALAKAKVSQLFALAIYSSLDDSSGEPITRTAKDDPTNTETQGDRYEVDFGAGPVKLELLAGDRAEFLESKSPSSEFQQYTELCTWVALKALDIPPSFYDEAHTNFFGSRAAWLHYERSCKAKRADVAEFLRRVTVWKIQQWIRDGLFTLPSSTTLPDLAWDWIPAGMPWWDPAKEIRGDLAAISAGLDTPQRIVRERGRGTFEDNIDQIAAAQEYARAKGVALSFDPAALADVAAGDPTDTQGD